MRLRAYKFVVLPILQAVNDEGDVVMEQQPQQPDVLFGVDALRRYADGFEDAVEQQNAASAHASANGNEPKEAARADGD